MSARNRKSGSKGKKDRQEDDAFDIWLRRGLHQLFDDVVNEPIPEDLLKLLEDGDDDT
ncbi:NepR family anti-sigma factor [Acetobacter estunensis]|uniref:NepR family anti-sigma factor n=1 Tax=Acetobacter estunensis TaxID=104097 RepID=UPI00140743F4|nr:NepR family anti-sigma factor [Acetobacter estunensis]